MRNRHIAALCGFVGATILSLAALLPDNLDLDSSFSPIGLRAISFGALCVAALMFYEVGRVLVSIRASRRKPVPSKSAVDGGSPLAHSAD